MRRRISIYSILFCLVFGTIVTTAQQSDIKLSTGGEAFEHTLVFEGNRLIFRGEIDHLTLTSFEDGDDFVSIQMPGYVLSGDTGVPALPEKRMLFEAEEGEIARIRIDQIDSVIFDLQQLGIDASISPSMPSVRKGAPAENIVENGVAYDADEWVGGPVVTVAYEGKMRGLAMSTLHFNPIRYNPVRNLVKVYFNVTCTIETMAQVNRKHIASRAFERLFQRVIRRNDQPEKKALFVEEPMTMVILSDTMFRETLQPFIQWKSRKGFKVVEAYRQESGVGSSRETIKSYLESLYTQPSVGIAPPTYLLIVGDVEHIPLSQSGGQITDLYYTTFDGKDDYIPDLFYGRISVSNVEQLQAVLDKVLEYEQYQFPDPSFLNEAVLIAGVDGTFASRYGNGQINYAHDHYINENSGFNAHTFLYPGSDTSDTRILELISGGVGFVNYTGHGLYDRWIDPTFHQNDIDGLENLGKYPVMIGNGCETNVFNLGECFAEALIRAPGKGALAYIGCTNDSYWDEDYFWAVGVGPIVAEPVYEESSQGYYDKVFHSHGESRELWTPSLGEMVFGGNIAVQQSNSSRKKFYWEIYQLAGDPSIVPWFSQPNTREVWHPAVLPIGSNRMDISCAPFDYVALSRNGVLLDALHASEAGTATLYISDTISSGTLELLVSGDAYIPFTGEVVLGIPPDPYLDLARYNLSDESVEKDGLIGLEEQFSLDMQWINRGGADLENDTLVLFTDHKDIAVLDSMVVVERVGAGDTVTIQSVFRIGTGPGVADQESLRFGLYWKGDQEGRTVYLKEKAYAPLLISEGIVWDDRPSGNGNGIAEPGEWLVCQWTIRNVGHFRTGKLTGTENPEGISVFERIEFDPLPVLEPEDGIVMTFRAQMAGTVKDFQKAGPFMAGDRYVTVQDSFLLFSGRHYEDFSNQPDRYPFINSSDSPWKIDNQTYTSSHYSLRSGAIPDYGVSELTVEFETSDVDTLSFAYRVSSEVGYDYLQFYVDSVLYSSWSGEKGWNRYFTTLEPGIHEITWSYLKDQSMSRGEDAAWIDDIVFPASAFRGSDLSLMRIIQPVSGPWLTNQEEVILLVRNAGMDTIHRFSTAVSLDDQPRSFDTITTPILPGEALKFIVSELFDLSNLGNYRLHTQIVSDSDEYYGNNQLEMEVMRYDYPDLALSVLQIDEVDGVHTDVVIAIENEGNTWIDSLRFESWIDGAMVKSGTVFIGLEPGLGLIDTFRLVDSTSNLLTTGFYDYLIRSAETDSALFNNEVSGVFYWHALGMQPTDPFDGLLLYPNPAMEGFYLILPQPAHGAKSVELVNIHGRVEAIFEIEKGSAMLYIPVLSLAPGRYMLKIDGMKASLPVVITD
ncbi:MAG: C25 family cysteine peptidase [Bacteroidota bacterium]